ncbi:hypothetical protein NQ314_006719 [Rhamnusium bicolor]|uniref:Nucleolar protein 11 n=1 Tax=Rhamnusium bicolor TaxID=1586634 RepID=A0AAV8Z0C2_9CUCU|nr:hypothetical protein NQ314_006719 [Rhamnusium bicolor]
MAKLGSYYGLCPLIDSKSLLGISEDSKKGVVIVTLGKNIASRYKFSSPVIYDKKQSKYLAAFNQTYIKLWSTEEENLDKLKKYKFNQQIHSIISNNDTTFVLFQNGSVYTLEDALKMRKVVDQEPILSDLQQVDEILYKKLNEQFYLGLIVKSPNESNLYWSKYSKGKCKFSKINLLRDGFILRGHVFHIEENAVKLLTLWSDGKIFLYPLEVADMMTIPGELFTVIESISTKHAVSMLSLDDNYIAMYGADCNEEGAVLIIYNTQFKVTQLRQPFKLFTNGAKLWSIENNLLLPVGQNLAVIPFYLETEQLAALVGSHKFVPNGIDADITVVQEYEIASWDSKFHLKDIHIPERFTYKINELFKQGLSESTVIGELLPDIFKEQDIKSLSLCLSYFSDIPEKYLSKILKYLVVLDSTIFDNSIQNLSKLCPPELQPIARTKLIDKILSKSFSEILLLPHLRSELVLNEVLLLINYICFLWSKDGHELPSMNTIKTEAKLIDWGYVLIDSNYQKLLLSKDESVRDVLIQFSRIIDENLKSFEDLTLVSTLLSHFRRKKCFSKGTNVINLKYSIEQISLY